MLSQGGRGGQKLPILLSKKTTKRGGGGQKSPILRRHSLWTAPYSNFWTFEIASLPIVPGHYSRKFGIPVIKKMFLWIFLHQNSL